ncbi:hypothetical protein HHK36_004143 [Tetracentron sinense]|uniref:Uncharacterized protein n=1 Tax=Tetracentron sinense TaxID=13715 RepID=A0A835DT52_TETSI|nr:hypothetical protein HHK36_004143 [Tetracentron sinense]
MLLFPFATFGNSIPIILCSMGFLRNPLIFLRVLEAVLEITSYRFILFSAGYEPLDAAIQAIDTESSLCSDQKQYPKDGILLFNGRLFCFASGSTAAALRAGIPQILCPFMLDQFYWAERMFWLGVAPEPLQKNHLLPDKDDDMSTKQAAYVLSKAINSALSPKIKARASEIAERISIEDGIREAVKILKEEIIHPSKIQDQTS